jgi:hypothetical protein
MGSALKASSMCAVLQALRDWLMVDEAAGFA